MLSIGRLRYNAGVGLFTTPSYLDNAKKIIGIWARCPRGIHERRFLMEISLTARKMELTDSIREFTKKKLGKVGRLFDHAVDARLVLTVEKQRHAAEVTIISNGFILHTRETTDDMYASIEQVAAKIEKLVKKHKKKTKNIRKDVRPVLVKPRDEPSSKDTLDALPEIIRKENSNKRPMTEQEATEQLRLSRDEFIMFNNATSDQVNVLYKRFDGNFGLIAP